MNPELTSQSWVGGASGLKPDRAQPVSGGPSLHSGLEAPPHPASWDHSKSGSHFDRLQTPCRVTWLGLALGESIHSLLAWRWQRAPCYPQDQPNVAPHPRLYK